MSITSKVKQSVVLTADGQVQKLINTATTSTATNIGKASILSCAVDDRSNQEKKKKRKNKY